MLNPMTPVLKEKVTLRSGRGAHWLTFDIRGDHGYVAPNKNGDDDTKIFGTRTHTSAGVIGSSEDMLEIDFLNGKISQVGDQYGIGRSLPRFSFHYKQYARLIQEFVRSDLIVAPTREVLGAFTLVQFETRPSTPSRRTSPLLFQRNVEINRQIMFR
jgi:hypothetical protein